MKMKILAHTNGHEQRVEVDNVWRLEIEVGGAWYEINPQMVDKDSPTNMALRLKMLNGRLQLVPHDADTILFGMVKK